MAMPNAFRTWPTPIRCRGVREVFVSFWYVGRRKRSMRTIKMEVESIAKTIMVPAEIWKVVGVGPR